MFQNARSKSADPHDHGRHTRRLNTGEDDLSTVASSHLSREDDDSTFVEPTARAESAVVSRGRFSCGSCGLRLRSQ